MPRRPTSDRPDSDTVTRADAARARRRSRETPQRTWTPSRTMSQIRSAVEDATATRIRTPKRNTTATRPTRRTSNWNAAAARTGRVRSTGASMALPQIQVSWRAASLAIVMLLSSLLLHLLSSSDYFVTAISLAGSHYVPGEDIYSASGVNNINILWIDPAQIKAGVEAVPGIKSAVVEVAWPNSVTIEVVENEPVLAWSQGGQTMWVDKEGVVFPARDELSGLLPIAVDDATVPLAEGSRIPVSVVEGALQLKQLRSNIELLHYDSANGLSYQDGRNWRGYFGAGADMEVKLAVYETLISDLLARDIHPATISVVDKDAPYYRK
ncbi:MAG: FtsQ-type POTRA domain-containing protein [Chloroflexi bacterium]|nr:FtsQ-type POTRA domain-containing protein [Chloroflexota bacterium]